MNFKVTVEHKDEFEQTFKGESSGTDLTHDALEDSSTAYQLIYHFERAFEACGFNKNIIKDYYCGEE